MPTDYSVRPEQAADIPAIRRINARAFGRPDEADLVDQLREALQSHVVSLVAHTPSDPQSLVGHVLFTPVTIVPDGDGEGDPTQGYALGPVAVDPDHQRRGVGSALIRAGLDRLREMQPGCPFVVVLGHPEYYPQFGFRPASRYRVRCKWPVPDDVFMLLPLDPTRMATVTGLAQYRAEFDNV